MSDNSRRQFLKTASVSAVGVAAASAVALPASTADAATPRSVSGPAHDGPFAVWVKNAASGEISVLVGETEVVHHDPALARTLARIAGRGATS